MKHTVLVVEDERDLREMLQDALEMNGYAVIAADDGQDARDKVYGVEHVWLMLMDLLILDMNGWVFFQKLRERTEMASVPVVVHSSVAAGRAPSGVTRVLEKPLRFDRLLAVVREYFAA